MILSALLLLTCLPTALMDFALPKWKADPNIRMEDAYKWTYQAIRGGEHAAPDLESARKWLEREWAGLGEAKKGEPVWEPLCPGGEVGRFNLRSFRDGGGNPDDLVRAFVESGGEYRSEADRFTVAWFELGTRLKKKSAGKLTHKAWAKLDAEMRAKNYPAIHHSETYKRAAEPAYRVLTLKQAKKLRSGLTRER